MKTEASIAQMNSNWFEDEKLHFAAGDGDLLLVTELINSGVSVNHFDELGMTPLHYAAKGEHFDVVRLLLSRGADVNAHCEAVIGETPLDYVVQTCSLKMAKLLIDAGADPTIPTWMQMTAIHRVVNRKRGEGPAVYELLRGYSAR